MRGVAGAVAGEAFDPGDRGIGAFEPDFALGGVAFFDVNLDDYGTFASGPPGKVSSTQVLSEAMARGQPLK